jgi:hypothetical protein
LKELMEDTTEQQHNVDAAYPQWTVSSGYA